MGIEMDRNKNRENTRRGASLGKTSELLKNFLFFKANKKLYFF
jgi:hypothetical protein